MRRCSVCNSIVLIVPVGGALAGCHAARVTGNRHGIERFGRARVACRVNSSPSMKHTKKKLGLKIETLRNLSSDDIAKIAGGVWTEATSCLPTVLVTCHPKTPGCPI